MCRTDFHYWKTNWIILLILKNISNRNMICFLELFMVTYAWKFVHGLGQIKMFLQIEEYIVTNYVRINCIVLIDQHHYGHMTALLNVWVALYVFIFSCLKLCLNWIDSCPWFCWLLSSTMVFSCRWFLLLRGELNWPHVYYN